MFYTLRIFTERTFTASSSPPEAWFLVPEKWGHSNKGHDLELVLNYFVFLSPLALTENQWITNRFLFICGTYFDINELYSVGDVIMSNLFIHNNRIPRPQSICCCCCCCSGEWMPDIWGVLFWIPTKLHTTFILVPNEFDTISVITVNSRGINEDLLLVRNCCHVETVISTIPGWPHFVRTFGLEIFHKKHL